MCKRSKEDLCQVHFLFVLVSHVSILARHSVGMWTMIKSYVEAPVYIGTSSETLLWVLDGVIVIIFCSLDPAEIFSAAETRYDLSIY